LKNLFEIYFPIVDGLLIFDNSEGKHELLAIKTIDGQLNIIDELKMKYPQFPYITGKINKEQRQKAVEQFQNDPETRGIICSISAAGVGLTLTEADHEIFVEMPWTPAETDQCEARAHRMGQKNNVLVSYLLADKSLDVAKFNLVEKKRQIMKFSSGKFENVNTISVFDVIKMLDEESSEEVI
jgi:SWI/SNF-related matrix-associated actin-dependent regulator 1 of chromatin subfamily A